MYDNSPAVWTFLTQKEEQRRLLSPRYDNFAPVSNASRLANSGAVAAVLARAVDRARGVA